MSNTTKKSTARDTAVGGTRRANRSGTVFFNEGVGKWQAEIHVVTPEGKKPVRRTRSTKALAMKALTELLVMQARGEAIGRVKDPTAFGVTTTVSDVIDLWLSDPQSFINNVKADIGSVPVQEITMTMISDCFARLVCDNSVGHRIAELDRSPNATVTLKDVSKLLGCSETAARTTLPRPMTPSKGHHPNTWLWADVREVVVNNTTRTCVDE